MKNKIKIEHKCTCNINDATDDIGHFLNCPMVEKSPDPGPIEEWGEFGSKERLELRNLLNNYNKNLSNGSRHEQAIIDFISSQISAAEQRGIESQKAHDTEMIKQLVEIDLNHMRKINEARQEEKERIIGIAEEVLKQERLRDNFSMGYEQALEDLISILKLAK